MNSFVGAASLARLILRRDRFRLTVWVLVLGLVPIATASAFAGLYPTDAGRQELAATVANSPALVAFLGPLHSASIGGLTAWRVGTLTSLLAGLMAVLTVIRHTREDEESGRRELLGSTVTGRLAPLVAALVVTAGVGLLIGVIVGLGLVTQGEAVAGSVAFGLGVTGSVLAFAAVGALAAQLTEAASTARGVGVAVVAATFLIRVAGDGAEASGLGWLTWLSPIGWFGRLRPFGDERWWVGLLWVGFAAVLTTVSFAIMSRRDIGAGAFPPRPGPARASAVLGGVAGLGWRLHRGSVAGWTVGLATIGLVFGAVGDSIAALLADNPTLAEMFEALGGAEAITDTFFSAGVGIVALVASAYAIRAVLRLRIEEENLRAEPILATSTRRSAWATSHLAYGILGPVLMLAASGLVTGVAYGLVTGDVSGQATRVLGAAMAQLPAVWVLTGVAMALFGLAPRMVGVSWGVLVACLLLGQLGQILQFPQWTLNLSPFSHIPLIPAEEMRVLPLAILAAMAMGLIGVGLVAFQRRDIQSG